MNILHKTLGLAKTLKTTIFSPSTTINGYQFSLSSLYSTNPHFNKLQSLSSSHDNNHTNTPSSYSKFGKNLGRPSEIPFQPKVANLVNFIGTVNIPNSFFTSIDGDSYAGTVISQKNDPWNPNSSFTCIPVIFQGDLAHTAATHLKKNVMVYIAGHLSPNPVPIKLPNDQLKVMVHDLYFVRGFPHGKNGSRS